MACCYEQVCVSHGTDCCCVCCMGRPQRPAPSMLFRQGIRVQTKDTAKSPANFKSSRYTSPNQQKTFQPKRPRNLHLPPSDKWTLGVHGPAHDNSSHSASIPSLKVTQDAVGPYISSHSNLKIHDQRLVRDDLWMADSRYYDVNRGPILTVQGREAQWVLTYKEFLVLNARGEPTEAKYDDYSQFYPHVEDLFIQDEIPPFAATSRCKQVKEMRLRNEGTTAIRYQLLRFPPTRAMRKILGRPGSVVNLEKFQPPSEENFFWKDTSLEFHFRELPGVILPGQAITLPIIFRPRKPGYFHEKIFLLTHPRLTDDEDRVYALKLSGICMEPECQLPSQPPKPSSPMFAGGIPLNAQQLAHRIKSQTLDHEATDILNAVLDNVLYDFHMPKSTMALGKITVEKIFYTHNKGLQYHFGVAESCLETMRHLVTSLVPKSQIMDTEKVCSLSIKELYGEVLREPPQTEFFWTNFKGRETEARLEKLSRETQSLLRPRAFHSPTVDSRIYSACYTTLVGIVYEIVARIANIDSYGNHDLDQVLRHEIRERLLNHKRRLAHKSRSTGGVSFNPDTQLDPASNATSQRPSQGHPSTPNLTNPTTPLQQDIHALGILLNKSDEEEAGSSSEEGEEEEDEEEEEEEEKEEEEKEEEDEDEDEEEEEWGGGVGDAGARRVLGWESGWKQVGESTVTDAEVEEELVALKLRKESQEKRVLFETLFGCGVERMMSVVDSFKAMYDYKHSDAIKSCQPQVCTEI